MPLYEYECESCGHRFEVIQKFADAPVKSCRACGGPVRKLLSSPAIQFKGSGWYITDYARKSGEKAPSGSDGSAASPASESTASTAKESTTTKESTAKNSSSAGAASTPAGGASSKES